MKKWFDGLMMAWDSHLLVPSPVERWNEEAKAQMLTLLPLVGLIVGAVQVLAALACMNLPLGIFALILSVLPWILTGFRHLDSFIKLFEAVFFTDDKEKRRSILDDRHVGSYGVAAMVLLMFSTWCAYYSTDAVHIINLLFIPAASRSAAYFAFVFLKPSSGCLLGDIKRDYVSTVVSAVLLAVSITVPVLVAGFAGLACLGAAIIYAVSCLVMSNAMDGICEDVSGFGICLSELVGIILAAIL